MAAAHDDDDPGFWPGYVAAVSGLVQGLLIVAMALGISIFAISHLAKLATQESGRSGKAGHGTAGADEAMNGLRGGTAPSPPMPILTPLPPQPVMPVAPLPLQPIQITFLGDATVTPASSAALISEAVRTRRAQGATQWRVEGSAQLDDPRARRASYLRLMGVRAMLMNIGIAASDIELELANASAPENDISAASADAGGSVIVIKPIVRPAAAMDAGAGA